MKHKKLFKLFFASTVFVFLIVGLAMGAAASHPYPNLLDYSDLESSFSSIASSKILPEYRDYVLTALKYHIESDEGDYRVAKNLERAYNANEDGNVVFFFDGCSINLDGAEIIFSGYKKNGYRYNTSAVCIVLQKNASGRAEIVYATADASTFPDNVRNESTNRGTAVPTLRDGVYNIKGVYHDTASPYHNAFSVQSDSVVRCTNTGVSYLSTSGGIHIHARYNQDYVTNTSSSSAGCLNVGKRLGSTEGKADYNTFMCSITGISNSFGNNTISKKIWGIVIVDRSNYRTQIETIYGNDNCAGGWTASQIANAITEGSARWHEAIINRIDEICTITYDANGGTGAPAPQTKRLSEKLILSSVEPTREGYKFICWKDTYNGQNFYPGGEYPSGWGNNTLVAQWEAEEICTITYDANGGWGAPEPQTKLLWESLILSTIEPTRVGYTFKGWKDTYNGRTFYPGDEYPSGWGDNTLVAQWEVNSYTIRFDANGGKGSMNSVTVNFGQKFSLPVCSITKLGYTCVGWNLKRDLDNKWHVADVGWETEEEILNNGHTKHLYSNPFNLTEVDGTWLDNHGGNIDFTLYAVWEKTDASLAGLTTYNGNVYLYYSGHVSWNAARGFCENYGGYLATITSVAEESAILGIIGDSYCWYGGYRDGDSWKWVTGEEFNYTNWAPEEPNNTGGTEFYLGNYYNRKWNDFVEYPHDIVGFVMEAPEDTPILINQSSFNGHTYSLYSGRLSWGSAKTFCENNNGHLITVTSADEQAFVEDLNANHEVLWFGGYLDNGTWKWVTDEAFSYTNWIAGEPNNAANVEGFLSTSSIDGKQWNDLAMYDSGIKGFIMETEPVSVTGVTLDRDSAELAIGETLQLVATVLPNTVTDKSVTWTSDKPSVATVDASGLVTAKGVGTATITVTTKDSGKTAKCTIVVMDNSVTEGPQVIVESTSGRPGSTVAVTVKLLENQGITGARLSISYPDGFTLTGIETGVAFSDLDFTMPVTPYLNPVTLSWDGLANDYHDGTLAILTFEVSEGMAEGSYPITVTYNEGDVYDENLENVSLRITNGVIDILKFMYGDVNNDGAVNGKDVTLIRRYISGGFTIDVFNKQAADVNKDNTVNGKDVTLIRRYISGGFGVVFG